MKSPLLCLILLAGVGWTASASYFESFDGNRFISLRSLGWDSDGALSAGLVATGADKNSRALAFRAELGSGALLRRVSLGPDVAEVWVDYLTRPVRVRAERLPPPETNPVVFYFDRNGNLVVYNGRSANWETFPLGRAAVGGSDDAWRRVTVAVSYRHRAFTIWLDGKRVAANIAFATESRGFDQFGVLHSSSETAYLDSISIIERRPEGLAGSTQFGEDLNPLNLMPVSAPKNAPAGQKKSGSSLFVPLQN